MRHKIKERNDQMIRVFDAFLGIGGFRSALERVGGFKFVAWCEIDRFAQKAYQALYDTGGEQQIILILRTAGKMCNYKADFKNRKNALSS